jgi:hypothetical protein
MNSPHGHESERKEAVAKAMRAGFAKDPRPWQATAILNVLSSSGDQLSPTAHFLVSNAGGGKSIIRSRHHRICSWRSHTHCLTVACAWIRPNCKAEEDDPRRDGIGVDSQKEKTPIADVESLWLSASNETLLLLSSPQRLVSSKSWMDCLSHMISNSLLIGKCDTSIIFVLLLTMQGRIIGTTLAPQHAF